MAGGYLPAIAALGPARGGLYPQMAQMDADGTRGPQIYT
jgi:hypothetical protein